MIRKATLKDIDSIMRIVAQAQRRLHSAGVAQWQDGYPSIPIFENDIAGGNCYVAEVDGKIVCFAVIILDVEPTYAVIEGGE
ncbi:MAG: GNAT family N-acetyltransferase, partial [Bacteroidales bacterium]|nr:GNAT family N-acetyltransferase [Bacteroidales bacterium]